LLKCPDYKTCPKSALLRDLHDLGIFQDGEFEWVFCSHTLEHCHTPKKVTSELYRVARKGVFWVVPLEDEAAWKKNPSHQFHIANPVKWLELLDSPEVVLYGAYPHNIGDLAALFVKRNP